MHSHCEISAFGNRFNMKSKSITEHMLVELIRDWENGMPGVSLGRKYGLSRKCQAQLQAIHITTLPPPVKAARLPKALTACDNGAVLVSNRRRLRMEEVVCYFLALRDGFRQDHGKYKKDAALEVARVLAEMKRKAV